MELELKKFLSDASDEIHLLLKNGTVASGQLINRFDPDTSKETIKLRNAMLFTGAPNTVTVELFTIPYSAVIGWGEGEITYEVATEQ